MSTNPCYKCECRTDRCHSDCELYFSWSIQHAEEKKRDYEERKVRQDLAVARDEKIRRLNRK